MNLKIRKDLEAIVYAAIKAVAPDEAVKRALKNVKLTGNVYLVSCGKAAWKMADTAVKCLDGKIRDGIVITKYDHVMGDISGVRCFEAGHPVPDNNSFSATSEVLKMTKNLNEDDTVLFLLSGGGSALFESPLCDSEELFDITKQLLNKGADIVEINIIRKRLSNVKGGRFGKWCRNARIEQIVLSDIIGDPLDMIASGPCVVDSSTCSDAFNIVKKYNLNVSEKVLELLNQETVKELNNVHTQIIGSVKELCRYGMKTAEELGYEVIFLSDCLTDEARVVGRDISLILKSHLNDKKKLAVIAGGETVVHVKGNGLGGRNQELALASAVFLDGIDGVGLISVGSDGTDGPTDAAGGYVDGDTVKELKKKNIDIYKMLDNNDAYHALEAAGGLIITGPTGTNVNDIVVGLINKN